MLIAYLKQATLMIFKLVQQRDYNKYTIIYLISCTILQVKYVKKT